MNNILGGKHFSTVTSKGQITLPKTIRSILDLNEKDTVEFTVQSDGVVTMRKNTETTDYRSESVKNLLDILLESRDVISIAGGTYEGKTKLASDLITNCLSDKRILIIEPSKELYHSVQGRLEHDVIWSNLFVLNSIEGAPIEVVVFDEIQKIDQFSFDWIHQLVTLGKKVIVVNQVFSDADLFYDSHLLITANRKKPFNVDNIKDINSNVIDNKVTLKKTLIYSV